MPKAAGRIKGQTSAPEKDSVSFRADPAFVKLLDREASKNGLSAGTYACTLVERAVTNSDHVELRHELEQVREEVLRVREDVATLAKVLLVAVAGQDKEQAEKWVKKHLLNR